MLLPQLKKIKANIEGKNAIFRTDDEKALLEELKVVSLLLTQEMLNESGFESKGFSLSAPADKCACCGK